MMATLARCLSRLCRQTVSWSRTGRGLTTSASPCYSSTAASKPADLQSRWAAVRDAPSFSDFLTDGFHRRHNYLRISVTERCNLRCLYCMPEEGVALSPNQKLLTTPEIVLLSSVFVSQGVTKIRLTGGEPTVRQDLLSLMERVGRLRSKGLKELCITTNGISLHRKLDDMVDAGLTGVNLSLDTLDPWQFQIMTRRKGFDAVQRSIERVLELKGHGANIRLKINCVVIRGVNDGEILSFVDMTRDKDLEVRFIEYMPFAGNRWSQNKVYTYSEMVDKIREKYPDLRKATDSANETSKTWQIPGFVGRIGFITSMTHNFCGSCNRLRITSDGNLKVCLFGNAEVSLRDIVRKSNNGKPIDDEAFEALKQMEVHQRHERTPATLSAGGLVPNEPELLDVIGMAVKGKKAKHAGMGELEKSQNRPMILIGPSPSLSKTWPMVNQRLRARESVARYFSGRRARCTGLGVFHRHSSNHLFSSKSESEKAAGKANRETRLSHVSETGTARMVSISGKAETRRIAVAACRVCFSNETAATLIRQNQMQKGDVFGVARVAGIMAAKRTPDLIPLCHPIAISEVTVDLALGAMDGRPAAVEIRATVMCEGRTGVEMEALMAASTAGLTVYDMCKSVDKEIRIEALRVVLKDGGRSGRWEAE